MGEIADGKGVSNGGGGGESQSSAEPRKAGSVIKGEKVKFSHGAHLFSPFLSKFMTIDKEYMRRISTLSALYVRMLLKREFESSLVATPVNLHLN